jgi:formylmethanofuran dehydrogenase subunit C
MQFFNLVPPRIRHAVILAAISLFCLTSSVQAAPRYWIAAGAGNWNDPANWSVFSGGSGGASVPGSGDFVTFDGNGLGNCTINAAVNIQGIVINPTYSGTITQNAGITVTVGSSGYTQGGGVFAGGDATIDLNGEFYLAGGTFTSTSGTLFIGGTFNTNTNLITFSAGTFNHNNGTVRLDPDYNTCAQRTGTVSIGSAITFNNFQVDVDNIGGCSESIMLVSGAGSMNIAGEFVHMDSYINTGTINIQGNLTVQTGADGGTATLNMNGTGAQEYSNASTARIAHLRINKTAGSVSPAVGTTTLLLQRFTLDAGTFTAPSGTLHVGGVWASDITLFDYNAGTFVHNSGTVRIDPDFNTCAQRTGTLDITSSLNFYNLYLDVDNTGGCSESILAISGASNAIVENDFTQFDGYANTGTVEVRGDVYLESGADGGSATILLNGTTDQEYFNTSTARFAHLRVNKTSGNVNPGVGTTSFLVQQFTLDAGTFNAPTGSFNVGGVWSTNISLITINGGTFNHNNGTVRLDPDFNTCAQRTATITASSPINFYNAIADIDNIGGCTESILSVSGSNSFIVENDFTQFDGFINTGTVEVRGDVYLESGADGGSATILLNGTTDQEYFNTSTARFAHLRVNKTSGNVNPGVGTTSFLVQQFTLDAGTFNAPTGSFNVGGVWSTNISLITINGGTFNHNNGTVRLDPDFNTCAQRTATITASSPINFYNAIADIDNIGGCTESILSVSGSNSFIVENDFTQFDGFINTGTVEVRGDVYLESGADGGSATILLNGTTDQEYFNTSTARFAHLRVNKTSGNVNPGAGTTSFLVQQFTLDAGTFNAPTGSFHVGGVWSTNISLITINGGTFNHNNGTVRLDPDFNTCAQRTATITASSPINFYNAIADIDNIGGCTESILSVSGSNSFIVENDFTQFDGFINTGTVEVRGDVYLESGADGGSATILLNGTTDQEYFNTSTARFAHLRVNKTTGVVTPGAGTTSFLVQQFTLDAGTFTAPTGSFNVGGVWSADISLITINGGTFVHNNGTVRIDPDFNTCAQRTGTITTSTTLTFFNLIADIDNIGGCTESILTVSGSSSFIVENDFTQFDGFINTGTVEVRGDIFLESGADGGTATILVNGTVDQEYNNASAARFAHLRVNKAAGSLMPGAGTTTFLVQRFTLDAGTFVAPTGTFNIGGTWSANVTLFDYNGGTFSHNNGTVRIDPDFNTCAQRTGTIDAASTLTFYNFYIDTDNVGGCTESILTATGTTTMNVLNNLTLNDGILNLASLQVQGNVTVTNTFDGGSASLTFTGGNAQSFDLTGATGSFNGDVNVNKSSNAVTLMSSCQLDAVSQDLVFISGNIITTTSAMLIIGDNVVVSGGSVGGYVDGPMRKIGNDAFTFPTGKSGVYSPIGISAPSVVTDAFTAEYFLADPSGAGYDRTQRAGTLTDIASCDYWILDRTAGTSNVRATLTWNQAAGCYGFNNTGILQVARWTGTQWADEGRTATTDNGTFGTVTSATITSFSPLAVASNNAPLPVELTSFTATYVQGTVELRWETASETDNDYFTVERSPAVTSFEEMTRVAGAGTTSVAQEYAWTDERPLPGWSYYRLKQTDFDGTFEYSPIISVHNPDAPDFYVTPNPVNRTLHKKVRLSEKTSVTVYNLLNQPVISVNDTDEIDISNLAPGVYLLRSFDNSLFRLIVE